MPVGLYRGAPLTEVSATHLVWALEAPLPPAAAAAIRHELVRRFTDPASRSPLTASQRAFAHRLLHLGYRQLARTLHPDVGGDAASMHVLAETHAMLVAWVTDHDNEMPAVSWHPSR
jgi:hypothetical protein